MEAEGAKPGDLWTRKVIASDLADGHALACADVLGKGSDQVIVGWRNKNTEGKVGLRVYSTADNRLTWKAATIDDNTMACEDLQVADLDGNGKLDIIAAGRATKNLKVYFND
jgi:hypothetical protein